MLSQCRIDRDIFNNYTVLTAWHKVPPNYEQVLLESVAPFFIVSTGIKQAVNIDEQSVPLIIQSSVRVIEFLKWCRVIINLR